MAFVTGILNQENYTTILNGGQHTIISDEPEKLGGKDEGMSPTELLAASLTSCSCITMKMYADRKGWSLEQLKVDVRVRLDIKTGDCTIEKTVYITGAVSEDDKSRLFKIASACPVHKLLARTAEITSTLG